MRDGILLLCILLGLYLVFAVYIALENKFNNDQIETLNEKVERLEEKLNSIGKNGGAVMPNIENVKQALEKCAIGDCNFKCPYSEISYGCRQNLMLDALALLKEQEAVVRCKYCKHSTEWYGDKRRCFLWNENGIDVFEDDYCSYGNPKQEGR